MCYFLQTGLLHDSKKNESFGLTLVWADLDKTDPGRPKTKPPTPTGMATNLFITTSRVIPDSLPD